MGKRCRFLGIFVSLFMMFAANSAMALTVTYDLNGGGGTTPTSTDCVAGEACELNTGNTYQFYRAGHVLVGWATSANATTGTFTMTLNADTQVFAVWTPCAAGQYKTSSAKPNAACGTCNADQWSNEGADMCSITVKYNLNGGTGTTPTDLTCTARSKCALADSANFRRAGYVFLGWSTDVNATTGSNTVKSAGNATVYAIWQACAAGQYKSADAAATDACTACSSNQWSNEGADACYKSSTITYNLNGGSGTKPESIICKVGTSCALNDGYTNDFYRAGYVLSGWTSSDPRNSVFNVQPSDYDITMYAVWTPCASGTYKDSDAQARAACSTCNGTPSASSAATSCTLSMVYDLNGGQGTTPSVSCLAGQACRLPDGRSTDFIRPGYIFYGWATSSDAEYGEYLLTFDEPTTLYAIWQPCAAGTYKDATRAAVARCTECGENQWSPVAATACSTTITVTYDVNGAGGSASSTKCATGKPCELNPGTSTGFYRAGYVLVGWATSADATTGTFTMTLDEDTELFAVWQPCGPGQYKTSWDSPSNTCYTCSVGYYINSADCSSTAAYGELIGCTAQRECDSYTACPGGYSVPEDCHFDGAEVSADKTRCVPKAGYYMEYHDGTGMHYLPCGAGTYSVGGDVNWYESSCSVPDTGYYASDCASDGTACASQTKCENGYYCSGGIRNSCAAMTCSTSTGNSPICGRAFKNSDEGASDKTQCYATILPGQHIVESWDYDIGSYTSVVDAAADGYYITVPTGKDNKLYFDYNLYYNPYQTANACPPAADGTQPHTDVDYENLIGAATIDQCYVGKEGQLMTDSTGTYKSNKPCYYQAD